MKLWTRWLTRRDMLIVCVAVMGTLLYVLAMHMIAGTAGFPLDDAWIHQTYGRNLALTGHFEYAPGVASAGSTSPFYTVLLAVGYVLHIPYFLWTYGLGALALALSGTLGARMAERLYPKSRHVGLLTGLALVMTWHLLWAANSGMETMLFSTLSLLLIYVTWRRADSSSESVNAYIADGFLFGLLGAVLIATRPEGVILVGLLVLAMLVSQAWHKPLFMWIIGALVGGAISLIPYLLLNLTLNGTVLPTTFSAKQAENAPLLAQPFIVNLWAMVQPLTAGGQLLLVPGAVWAVWRLLHRQTLRQVFLSLIPLIWAGTLVLLYVLRLPAYYQHGRYVIPALAPFIVVGAAGTLDLFHVARRKPMLWLRVGIQVLVGSTVALFAAFWIYGAVIFARDVQMINSDMVVASHWLADHVASDQLIAVHDIGAIGYFAPRPILDLAGLISPEVIPIILDHNALMTLLEARNVRYLMVLPGQNPANPDDPRLCQQFNANGLMGGMAIYKLAWNGHCN